MAQRRMFSLKIVDSDAFLDMPTSSQLLYFHLSMRADDDGFVGNPKKITKMVSANDDDLKILLSKRFILSFESGVVVIKHWKIHNYIQNDRHLKTQYQEEKNLLVTKENGSYTECIQNVSKMDTQVRLELGKDRIGKDRIEEDSIGKDNSETSSEEIPLLIKVFETLNPASKKFYGNKTQRNACQFLIDTYTFERVKSVVEKTLPKTNGLQFFPTITTPLQLQDKWITLESAIKKYQAEHKKLSSSVAF